MQNLRDLTETEIGALVREADSPPTAPGRSLNGRSPARAAMTR